MVQVHGVFGNDFAKNVVIFVVDKSSQSHAANHKSDFSVLGEQITDDVNGSIGAAEQKFSINFSEARTKVCLSLHYNHNNSYLSVNGKKICKFIADNKSIKFPTHFRL